MGQNEAVLSSDLSPKTATSGAAKAWKMGPKREYKGKYNMEVPKSVEPFFNVEEGLKISLFTVYIMLQNRLHIGQK